MSIVSERKDQAKRFLFACLASFSVLAICTKSSFLYPMNDWVDVNCFFTVGRGILHGMTPYLDLYEQKGPLIYFLYALAAQISETSFLGVYLIESICFAIFLYLSGRLAEVLSGFRYTFWIFVPLLAVLIPVSPAFSHGGSAEELILPVLAAGLYTVLRAVKEQRPLTNVQGFALGLCTAAALWVKYTFCGLFAGLAAAVLIWYCCSGKTGYLLRLILFFLSGFLALSAAVAGWFAVKGALGELWQVYFVNNLTQYSQNIRSGRYDAPLPNLLNNLSWSVPGILGLVWLVIHIRKHGWEALAAGLGAVCLFVFTYASGRRYPYYALVMAVFAPLGPAAAGTLIRSLTERISPRKTALTAGILAAVLLLFGPLIAFRTSTNVYLMQTERKDMPQYRFAEIIRQSDEPTLLNYGFLDGGFYYAAGVLPSGPYFCTLNIDLPEMEKDLQASVQEGRTEFVITRQRKLQDAGKYKLVDEAEMVFEGMNWRYYLYQRIEPEQ